MEFPAVAPSSSYGSSPFPYCPFLPHCGSTQSSFSALRSFDPSVQCSEKKGGLENLAKLSPKLSFIIQLYSVPQEWVTSSVNWANNHTYLLQRQCKQM